MEPWGRLNYQPCLPLGEDGLRVTACEKHTRLSREAAAEGMVLLKNEKSALPLRHGARIALFGRGQSDFIAGGQGSSAVNSPYTRTIVQGLEEKEREGKVQMFRPLSQYYTEQLARESDSQEYPASRIWPEEPDIPAELLRQARDFAEIAVLTISRSMGEGRDRSARQGDGDFYLSAREQKLVETLSGLFPQVVAVLNIGGVMDVSWFSENPSVQAALITWFPGMEGGRAVADILCGDAVPSGRLTDTFARSYDDYPSAGNFLESDEYVNYTEDIYVGYRYFETIPGARQKVIYPFGYGLSYTSFRIQDAGVRFQGRDVEVSCKIHNAGAFPGKDVFQVYIEAPQGLLGKPRRELAAFSKTAMLQPGESEVIVLSFSLEQAASYDDLGKIQQSAYVLEDGEYAVYGGESLQTAVLLGSLYLPETQVVEQLTRCAPPTRLAGRMRADGSMEPLPALEYSAAPAVPAEIPSAEPQEDISVFDLQAGRLSLDAFVAQLTDDELSGMLHGQHITGVSSTGSFGGSGRYSRTMMPPLFTTDGPSGIRILERVGLTATSFPCATQMACTWNTELVEAAGAAIAEEVKENNLAVWLAPGLNIHRNPLCGRNFEYYSEDPLLSGKMAAAMIRGAQSRRVAATIKHFACNNKETNRKESDSRVSERALREIYLRGFEIAVKESDPWALMTSYNRINGVRGSQQYDLITRILRGEWGFDGVVMTDWSVHGGRIPEILAGNDVKMPRAVCLPEKRTCNLAEDIRSGSLARGCVQASVKRVLKLMLKMG